MISSVRRKLLALAGVVLPLAASAHHSTANYDMEHLVPLEGTVRTVSWTNPHITFVIAAAKVGGEEELWTFEASSPGVLGRSGWTKQSVRPGDQAVFYYAPLRAGGHGGLLSKVAFPDGRTVSYSLTPVD